jgi:hypothetical protein
MLETAYDLNSADKSNRRPLWATSCRLVSAFVVTACGSAVDTTELDVARTSDSIYAEPSPDISDIGAVEQPLIVPTGSRSTHACTGHTSGMGQRVIGTLATSVFDGTVRSVWGTYIRLDLTAVNYKRNIGWHRKPTSQLAIDLIVDGVDLSFWTDSTISELYDYWELPYDPADPPEISVTFHGRDGSFCSL